MCVSFLDVYHFSLVRALPFFVDRVVEWNQTLRILEIVLHALLWETDVLAKHMTDKRKRMQIVKLELALSQMDDAKRAEVARMISQFFENQKKIMSTKS